jgi:hypothetical protein
MRANEDWRGLAGRLQLGAAALTVAERCTTLANEHFRRYHLPWDEAQALYCWGATLIKSGDRKAGDRRLNAAATGCRRHGRPISASLLFLTPTLQRSVPDSSDSPQHAAECVRAEVQSEVLVETVEHLRQVHLLSSHGLVAVHLDPRRVFLRQWVKPRKVKASGFSDSRPGPPCSRLPSKRSNAVFSGTTRTRRL